jgi:hypothetical protein
MRSNRLVGKQRNDAQLVKIISRSCTHARRISISSCTDSSVAVNQALWMPSLSDIFSFSISNAFCKFSINGPGSDRLLSMGLLIGRRPNSSHSAAAGDCWTKQTSPKMMDDTTFIAVSMYFCGCFSHLKKSELCLEGPISTVEHFLVSFSFPGESYKNNARTKKWSYACIPTHLRNIRSPCFGLYARKEFLHSRETWGPRR